MRCPRRSFHAPRNLGARAAPCYAALTVTNRKAPTRDRSSTAISVLSAFTLLATFATFAISGCGRKADESDCSFILDRNVEVQMKQMKITDPVAVAKRKDEIRGEMKDSLKDCVGKRVTDAMLSCVRKADTADDIDKCMR